LAGGVGEVPIDTGAGRECFILRPQAQILVGRMFLGKSETIKLLIRNDHRSPMFYLEIKFLKSIVSFFTKRRLVLTN
jgi:hypothetical protein